MKLNVTSTANVRWLIGRDLDECVGIDSVSFDQPLRWSRAEWGDVLREKDTIGIVYSCKETMRVFGVTIYRLRKLSIDVLKVAVHPLFRRQGIGRSMSEKIRTKLTQQRRQHATAEVEERNLDGQLWLQSCGWKCVTSVGPSHDRVLRFVIRPQSAWRSE
jgi:ribosomal protein S18 acetylase RimI-like enzyme